MKPNLRIIDLPQEERPREKLLKYGAEHLSNAELLAIVLRVGSNSENIIHLCDRILGFTNGLEGLLNLSPHELMTLKGVKSAKAAQLSAVAEVAKRMRNLSPNKLEKITSPRDAAELVIGEMNILKQEVLKLIMLNTKNCVIVKKNIFVGSLNSSIVHPREIFSEALKANSASIIVCHNHPSGDPEPSSEDVNITLRLKECGKIVGIDLIDHIIIGGNSYVSLKEKGII